MTFFDHAPMTATFAKAGSSARRRPICASPGGVVVAAVALHGDSPPPPLALRVLRTAAGLAELSGSELHVVDAWELVGESILACPIRGVSPARLRILLRRTARVLEARVEGRCAEFLGSDRARVHLVHGDPREVIPVMSRRLGADLVVMGVPDRSPRRWFPELPLVRDTASRIGCDLLALRGAGGGERGLFKAVR